MRDRANDGKDDKDISGWWEVGAKGGMNKLTAGTKATESSNGMRTQQTNMDGWGHWGWWGEREALNASNNNNNNNDGAHPHHYQPQHPPQQQMTHCQPPASWATAHGVDGSWNNDRWLASTRDKGDGGEGTTTTTTTKGNKRQQGRETGASPLVSLMKILNACIVPLMHMQGIPVITYNRFK
jgi:hypothetical protein